MSGIVLQFPKSPHAWLYGRQLHCHIGSASVYCGGCVMESRENSTAPFRESKKKQTTSRYYYKNSVASQTPEGSAGPTYGPLNIL